MLNASGYLAWWSLRISEFSHGVVHRAGVKYQAADLLPRLLTYVEETTHLDEDLTICILENIQVTDDETTYLHVCTERDVEVNLVARTANEETTKKVQAIVTTVQPRERQNTEARYQRKKISPSIERKTRTITKLRRKLERVDLKSKLTTADFKSEHRGSKAAYRKWH